MNKSILKDAVIAVTYRCNSRCRMCNIWQKTDFSGEFLAEELSKLPDSLRDINISGGEPFLRTDLLELIKNIKIACPRAKVIISSNGFATELIIEQVKKIITILPDLGIAISIDGVGEAHNQVRGIAGGYDRVIETINQLKALGLTNIRIGFTMGDYNTEELQKVYQLAEELKIELTIAVVHSSENYFGKENKIERKEKLIEQLDWLIQQELKTFNPKRWGRAYFTYGLKQLLITGKRILPDYSGKLNIFIDPTGAIYPCDVSSEKIGELKNIESLKADAEYKDCAESWMMCTARPAIKKHLFKGAAWVVKNKF